VARAVPVFARARDERGLCRARQLEARSDWIEAKGAAAAAAWEEAAAHARRAGDEHERAALLSWVASSLFFGPVPVDDGIRRCEEIRATVASHLASEGEVLRPLGGLHGMAGRFDVARALFATSNAVFDDLGLRLNSVISHPEAVAEMLAGEFAVAEQRLRSGYDALAAMGEKTLRSTTAAILARAIHAQGRSEEAERFTELSEELADARDLLTQMIWRGVRARILAERGRGVEAELLAFQAVALAERTDFVTFHADALSDLAHVLQAAGRAGPASAAAAEAVRLYERKGNVVAATEARSRLDDLARV
jgi:hypothetical protein